MRNWARLGLGGLWVVLGTAATVQATKGSPATAVRQISSWPCTEAVCHRLRVTCAGVSPREVTVREFGDTEARDTEARGTVVFATGVYGNKPYDEFPERAATLRAMSDLGFEVFEIRWGGRRGWGEGAEGAGFTAALCGYSEVVRWLVAERADRPRPLCVQGNSGAALQIAYGLAVYELGEIVDLAVLSGGPPITRIDRFCFAPTPLEKDRLWKQSGRRMVDQMMGWDGRGDYCRNAAGPTEPVTAAVEDSLVGPAEGRRYDFPETAVVFVESEGDKSSRQGRWFYDAITSTKTWRPVAGKEHGVDRTLPGAAIVREILESECRAP